MTASLSLSFLDLMMVDDGLMDESSIFPLTLLSVFVYACGRYYYQNFSSANDEFEYDEQGGSTRIDHGNL